MNDKLKDLIVTCVTKNTVFVGTIGSAYSVQDLVHAASLQTINTLHGVVEKAIEKLDSGSLFKNPSSAKKASLELERDTLAAVFEYKQGLVDAAKTAEKTRADKAEKLRVLKDLKSVKDLEALGKLSQEEIDAEIAALEA